MSAMTPPTSSHPGRNRSRIAWRVAGTVIAILMLTFGTANLVSALAHTTWRVHRVIAAPVRVVEVHASSGSITIIGAPASANRGAVTIDMTVSRGLETPSRSVTVEGERLLVRDHCPWPVSSFCQVDYTLHVPEDVSVIAQSDGDISVSHVRGDVGVESDGDVELRDVAASRVRIDSNDGDIIADGLSAASVEASTDNGDVLLRLDAPPTTIDASSNSGDVEIALPDTPDDYRVQLSSNGGTRTVGVRTSPSSHRTIAASSDGGDVTVRYRTG